jgi:hypothetical protein
MNAILSQERAIRRLNHRLEALGRCLIRALPNELLLRIFSLLDPGEERRALSLVCRGEC